MIRQNVNHKMLSLAQVVVSPFVKDQGQKLRAESISSDEGKTSGDEYSNKSVNPSSKLPNFQRRGSGSSDESNGSTSDEDSVIQIAHQIHDLAPQQVTIQNLMEIIKSFPFNDTSVPLNGLIKKISILADEDPKKNEFIIAAHTLVKGWAKLHEKDDVLSGYIFTKTKSLFEDYGPSCLKGMSNLIGYVNYYLDSYRFHFFPDFVGNEKYSVYHEILLGLNILGLYGSSPRRFSVIDKLIDSMTQMYLNAMQYKKDYTQSQIESIGNGDFQTYQTLSIRLGGLAETAGRWTTKFEPRGPQIMFWIREGVEIAYPIPIETAEFGYSQSGIDELYNDLHNVFTSFAFFNFTLDDLADEVRDQVAVDAYSQIFPSCEEDDESLNPRYRSHTKPNGTYEQLTSENVARFLDDYLKEHDAGLNSNEELRGALINYLQFSFNLFHKTLNTFEDIIHRAEEIAKLNLLEDDSVATFDDVMDEILYTFYDVFANYLMSVKANNDPSSYLDSAALKSHNNMNMVPFHMMMTWVNLTLAGVKKDLIISIFKREDYVQMIEAEQKMGRYGNCVATAAPRNGQQSRELQKGDISGMYEVTFELKKKSQCRTLKIALNKHLKHLSDPDKRIDSTLKLIEIFIKNDSEYILLKLFTDELEKIKKHSETIKAFVTHRDINPNLLFTGLNELESESPTDSEFFNSFFELFYFHIVGRGKI